MKPTWITTPIALSRTNRAVLTLPWFVQRSQYAPEQSTFRPLVNGEEAFGEVHDAILAAKASIDIVCWGFQPSMYFRRGTADALSIGQLLARKGAEGVRVRLLCWQDDIAVTAWAENNAPGNNFATMVKPYLPDWLLAKLGMVQRDYQADFQREFDLTWYRVANANNVSRAAQDNSKFDRQVRAAMINTALSKGFPNIALATRGFDLRDRAEIAYRSFLRGEDKERSNRAKAQNSAAMAIVPTHHQKMVLIDYESPKDAVGFVMGHNMLDTYWDHDHHSHVRLHPRMGRNGLHPRQDISSRVTGPVLRFMNHNFCEAWDDATGHKLMQERAGLGDQLVLDRKGDTLTMAQLLRTQPQKNKTEIQSLYLQAVNNVARFIYIENQYFRFPPLAEQLKKTVRAHIREGRDPGKHGPVHLFVVTNSNDDGIGPGTVNTYRMLEALGRADVIPGVAKLERTKARNEKLAEELKKLDAEVKRAKQRVDDYRRSNPAGGGDPIEASYAREAQITIDYAPETRRRIEEEMNKPPEEVLPIEIEGLKVHVCTLVAPDSPPGKWDYVYVHSKLMIVDDVFMTLGSANINTRSMMTDSELNICHENVAITRPLRKRLWDIHTNGLGAQEDVTKAFKQWQKIIKENTRRQSVGGFAPYASLIEFLRTDPTARDLD